MGFQQTLAQLIIYRFDSCCRENLRKRVRRGHNNTQHIAKKRASRTTRALCILPVSVSRN